MSHRDVGLGDAPKSADASAGAEADLAASVAGLLAQFEAQIARRAALRRAVEAADLTVARLSQALETLAPTLPAERAAALRRRLVEAARVERRLEVGADAGPMRALLGVVASWEGAAITPADGTAALTAAGCAVSRTYAANAMATLAKRGVLRKAGHGRYAVNRDHPDVTALRLQALEAELADLSAWEAPAA